MSRLQTALTEMLGVRVPLMNAPMTPQAGGLLARAVSAAGGFGMLGFDEDEPDDAIAAQVDLVTAAPRPAFGIGLVAWVVARRPALLDLAIAAKPSVVSISFGDVAPYVERLREAGILVASQVQNARTARLALSAGVDIVVAQGAESGGHTGTVGTLPLLQLLLDLTDKPVVAAGGIASGRGLAAVLSAGAAGAWAGTPFLLASESRMQSRARAVVIESDETQTIYTSVFDRVQGKGWTSEHRGRAIRNAFAQRWDRREDELVRTPAAIAEFQSAKAAQDYSTANIYAGQSVGMLDATSGAAEIVERYERDAIARLAASRSLVRDD